MKAMVWTVLAAAGLGLMLISYDRWIRGDPDAPGAFGFLCVGDEQPAGKLDAGTSTTTRLRYLPVDATTEAMLKGVKASIPRGAGSIEAQIRPKLIELPVDEMGLLVGRLKEGRMPEPGRDELLAGPRVSPGEPPTLGGRTFSVVGVLQPTVALFANSYLIPKG